MLTVQSDISAHRECSHNNLSDVQLIKKKQFNIQLIQNAYSTI